VLLGVAISSHAGCGDDAGTGGNGGAGGSGAAPSCTQEALPEDTAAALPVNTPRWAFRPWISKDISSGADSRTFVQGFLDRDIPVGVLVLDSPWMTHYNTYIPNPDRYPEFETMVSDFRALGVRTVVWTTQMINSSGFDFEMGGDLYEGPSPDFLPAQQCGFFVNGTTPSTWWKGSGQGIDFFNPDARVFWHRMLDRVLDLGVSGFKLDFGENYLDPQDPITTFEGPKTLQEYSERYYEDFYAYGGARFGTEEFLTMVRPYDASYQYEGRFFARKEHAPVAWVGDNRRDYVGLVDALDHIFRSAEAGYVVVGSDLGGYLDVDDANVIGTEIPFDPDNFMRWTALSAMTPFMQLHGRANFEPWALPEKATEATSTYYVWGNLHDQLVPFFDSVATAAYAGSAVMIDPVGETEAEWADDWRYWLGDAFLVVPVIDATGVRDVELPDDARYFALFDEAATPIEPGTLLTDVDVSDPTRIPVFFREGAIVPMEVANDATPFGTAASAGRLTLVVVPAEAPTTFDVIAEDDAVEATVEAARDATGATVSLGAHERDLVLRVRIEGPIAGVSVDGAPLDAAASQAAFDAGESSYLVTGGWAWVRLPAGGAKEVRFE
jgi:alpha-glucosidase (family GH31 glycosyl hydrolase)